MGTLGGLSCQVFNLFVEIEGETRRQGDRETRRQGDRETGRQGDRETRRQGDKETGRQGDGLSIYGIVE